MYSFCGCWGKTTWSGNKDATLESGSGLVVNLQNKKSSDTLKTDIYSSIHFHEATLRVLYGDMYLKLQTYAQLFLGIIIRNNYY